MALRHFDNTDGFGNGITRLVPFCAYPFDLLRQFGARRIHVSDVHCVEDRPIIVDVEGECCSVRSHVDCRLTKSMA